MGDLNLFPQIDLKLILSLILQRKFSQLRIDKIAKLFVFDLLKLLFSKRL